MARGLIPGRSVLLVCAVAAAVSAQSALPELTRPVNDFAEVVDADSEARLTDLIERLQAATGDVLVVATIKTFQPEGDIRTYAARMFENHGRGIGQKGKDNGLLVLMAVDDRQVWAEVGYDLEGIITDGFAGETSRLTMTPYFRKGEYGEGLMAGATRFAERIAESRGVTLDGVPIREPAASPRRGARFPFIFVIFMVMIVLNLVQGVLNRLLGRTRRGRRRRWGSSVGPFGAGYGGWSSRGGGWSSGGGGFGGGFGGFGGGRSGGGGGGASW